MASSLINILLIEDQPVYRSLLEKIFNSLGFKSQSTGTLKDAFELLKAGPFDVILLDLGLPDSYGLETFEYVKNHFLDVPIIILTGLEDERLAETAIHLGAQDYLVKGPYLLQGEATKNLLSRSIRYAIERHQSQIVLIQERDSLEARVTERTAELNYLNQQLRDSSGRLRILQESIQAILSAQSPQSVAQVALQRFWRLLPYSNAEVFSLDDDQDLHLIAWHPDEWETKLEFAFHELILPQFFETTEYHLNVDLRTSQDTVYEEWLWEQGLLAYCLVPLLAKGKLIGVVSLGSQMPQIFTDGNLDSALELSRQLALVIYNAQLLEKLQLNNDRLSELAEQIISAQEDERRRISLELHDETGQALTALGLTLNTIKNDLGNSNGQSVKRLEEASILTKNLMEQIRNLAHNLHPPALKTVGLDQAMLDYCQTIEHRTGMRVTYNGSVSCELPDHIQITLYRILQESITNIIKHAMAKDVEVNFILQNGGVSLSVKDDGVGVQGIQDQMKGKSGIGLRGIKDRLEALGGLLILESQNGKGFLLQALVPMDAKL